MTGLVRRRAEGQALPEFAIVLPIFLLLAFAIMQIGLLLSGDVALVNGTRDAVRAAVTYRVTGAAATQAACSLAATDLRTKLAGAMPGFSAARLKGVVTYAQVAGPSGAPALTVVTNDASYAQPLVIPLVGAILDRVDGLGAPAWAPAGDTLVLGARESMRLEGSAGGGTVTCAF